MHWMYPYGGGWYMMAIWWLLMLVIIALAVGWFSRQRRSAGINGTNDSALEILKRRYARGEISKEEFEEKKKDLA